MPAPTTPGTANVRRAGRSGVAEVLLRSVPLLSNLTPAQIAVLAPLARRYSFSKGETIIGAGEPTRAVYVIISGRVHVAVTNTKGKQAILALLKAGDYFGEMSLIDDEPRSADVIARTSCELLALDRPEFARCLESNFELTMAIGRGLVQRLRDADNRIGSLALLDVYGRVSQLLIQQAETVNGVRVISGTLSRIDMAKMIGASREMVTRVLKDLQQRGFIDLQGSTIVLHDGISTLR